MATRTDYVPNLDDSTRDLAHRILRGETVDKELDDLGPMERMFVTIWLQTDQLPPPKRGGTYFYCTNLVSREVTKLDSRGRKTRYTETVEAVCDHRTRTEKKYRRHWRRTHADALTST